MYYRKVCFYCFKNNLAPLKKNAKILLKGKDDFCCASIFSPALPTGSTLQSVLQKEESDSAALLNHGTNGSANPC